MNGAAQMDDRIAGLADTEVAVLRELSPLLRRAAELDGSALVRLRGQGTVLGAFVKLPFKITVARSVSAALELDVTMAVTDLLALSSWVDGGRVAAAPSVQIRDLQWRESLPSVTGWTRLDTVPDETVRTLVRSGALALKQAGQPGGLLETQPRAADALLDTVVLTVTGSHEPGRPAVGAEITLRMVSALTRMGFLPRGSHAAIDVCGSWTRIVAEYGSVYTQSSGLLLR